MDLSPYILAGVGILGGIVGGWFSARWQSRLEFQKWARGKEDAFTTELRSSVKDLTTALAAACHSMCWLCWLAEKNAERITEERIQQYDQEMHVLLPQITGLHAVIAGMDYQAHQDLKLIVEQLIKVDARIGEASLHFVPGSPESAKELADLYRQALELEKALSQVVAEAIRPYAAFNKVRGK